MARKASSTAGKHRATYLKAWRLKRGFTQQAFIDRLDALLEGVPPDERKVPKTTASLSRIEDGKQPYDQRSLEAFAAVLDIEAWQLLRDDPAKGGEVIDMVRHLKPDQLEQLRRVMEAMFPRTGTGG